MWSWIKRSVSKKPASADMGSSYDPSKDDPLVPKIFFAGYVLNVAANEYRTEEELVAEIAVRLLEKAKSEIETRPDRSVADFLDGLFLLCISNVYSSHMRISFEKVAMISLTRRFATNPNMGDLIPEAIANYNEMMGAEDDAPRMIFSTLLKWTENPGPEETNKLQSLYSLLAQNVR